MKRQSRFDAKFYLLKNIVFKLKKYLLTWNQPE